MTGRLCAAAGALTALIAAAAEAQDEAHGPDFPCLNPPTMSAEVPGDTPLSDQPSLNCFAWQEFIALNWSEDTSRPASGFGTPRDQSPVVFETYENVHDLFRPDGSRPAPWGGNPDLPVGVDAKSEHARLLSRISKFGASFEPGDIDEAAPGNAWLADTGVNLVWYEVLVNRAEYDYFIEHGFYDGAVQAASAGFLTKIDLPRGELSGNPGAMEVKAAWLTVPESEVEDARWDRYKLAPGVFCSGEGADRDCTESTMALVGLHIIHKTVSQPSWIWATFEHVDNAPDHSAHLAGAVDRDYAFYSRQCTQRDIPAECLPEGAEPARTTCEPNQAPPYALELNGGEAVGPCQPYPIQVTRVFPTPDTDENPLVRTNAAAQALIRQANGNSVYQYYKLVNVLWNDSPVDENRGARPPLAPLSDTGFRPNPSAFPVANTTLETYVQETTCIACHSGASVAKSSRPTSRTYASDYSFVFGLAQSGD